jgi:hypothetical protein
MTHGQTWLSMCALQSCRDKAAERQKNSGNRRSKVGFAPDSALEGDGFEPSVPLVTASLILAEDKGLQADPARAGTAA